jgi:hypothetical protein
MEMNMSKKFKSAFLAAVLALISAISSPVLANEYDPALNGGGSNGYNTTLGAGNS